jgi:7-carboxy-7-deazaguanine synthase
MSLTVSEVFGPTWQGEGPSTGRRAGFVRLGRCNLTCAWCDTPYTWDWARFDQAKELDERPVDEIVAALEAMSVDLVVITGGEPLLQQHRMAPLLEAAVERAWRVEVETNGTIAPEVRADQWNVSPKLANSEIPLPRRYRPDVLRAFQATGGAVFKFVATTAGDLDEVGEIVDECGLTDVWIMPEGRDAHTVSRRLAELAPSVVARGWNLSPRLHVQLWGDARGV